MLDQDIFYQPKRKNNHGFVFQDKKKTKVAVDWTVRNECRNWERSLGQRWPKHLGLEEMGRPRWGGRRMDAPLPRLGVKSRWVPGLTHMFRGESKPFSGGYHPHSLEWLIFEAEVKLLFLERCENTLTRARKKIWDEITYQSNRGGDKLLGASDPLTNAPCKKSLGYSGWLAPKGQGRYNMGDHWTEPFGHLAYSI